ncbi:MAG: winged helix-turn-helix transcriptional regulator [Nitrosopumilus sp.]|nr:winged helix-turn-helix transcriptional regulator [Nitrosopumilus sp.]NNL52587.1 winged helix-turn-helix transcriptional regulator [Nitrosopumilus sp.]NNM03303.1 winged helix-turn-helix transcriptional regulator [Nitrosopumilus sp.]
MIKGDIRHNQILEIIHENPGLNFRDIMRITGFKNGVLSYYVNKLEKWNRVTVIRKIGSTRFFPKDIPESESSLLEMLRRPTPYDIIFQLFKNPDGLTMNEIIKNSEKSQSTISTYLQLLLSKKIIIVRLGEKKKIFVLKNMSEFRYTIQKYNFKPVSKTIQNFNEMFESL